jgi:hypothetical protein
MTKDNASKNVAKYLTLPEYAKINGVSMAWVMRECGLNDRNPGPYKNHYVVTNSDYDMSLQREKTVRAFS